MQNLQADVIVIAAGAAVRPAAISAAQGGASVLVFEKEPIPGGTANRGMGPLGIESRHTRMRQFKPTKDEGCEVFMEYTHWRVDAQLVRAYLNKSGDTIYWLESLGVKFLEPASYFHSAYPTWHLIKPPSGIPAPCAAGTDACSIYGDSYVFIMPGNSMVNTGRIVGENAVRCVAARKKTTNLN